MTNPSRPSHLDPTARGGDTSEGGLSFQAAVTMAHIPVWMAKEGFSAMIRESIFDTEASFFVPRRGIVKEAIEAKDHPLAPKEFWDEIDQFQKIDAGSPGTYAWFTLASSGLSEALHPLRNGLRRIRDPYEFYRHDTAIIDQSFDDYVKVVDKLGRTKADAEFLYNRVQLADEWSLVKSHWQGVFSQALLSNLPYHQNYPGSVVSSIFAELGALLQSRRNIPITRIELERVLETPTPDTLRRGHLPVRLLTAIDDSPGNTTDLRFDWERFFGGAARIHVSTTEWNSGLLGELNATKQWIAEYRQTKRIIVDGTRRLSASLAIGNVFSAVSGFAIDMVHRGQVWSTDAHGDMNTPEYSLAVIAPALPSSSDRLIVSIGIPKDIRPDVMANLDRLGLGNKPVVHFVGLDPLVSAQQVNVVVQKIKTVLTQLLQATGAKIIDLFLAGPGQLALFLGHRLNATAVVQCYEMSGDNIYVPTVILSK